MNYIEEKMIELAKRVFKDIDFDYYETIPLKAKYKQNEKLIMHPEVKNCWTVSCKWFDPDFLDGMDKSGFLIIDDDTGEPVVLILATGGGGNCVIAKDSKGKYYVERNY